MPYFLRAKHICFYCNAKTPFNKSSSIRQFSCQQCDAVNYLDENGDITDPPVHETPREARSFATDPSQALHPDLSQGSDIFCATCLKNQNIYVTTLSTYFPDQSDPRYGEYEAKFPEFKTNLEKRYPQVCADCVSLVNNRLQSMTYLTRAENLRVTLDKTRRGLIQRRQRGWRDLAIFLGSLAWFGSILCQFVWHLLGVTLDVQNDLDGTPLQCFALFLSKRTTTPACFNAVNGILPWALRFGLLSIWWNNRLLDSVHGAGRLAKLNDYYFLQIVFLGVRFFTYKSLRDMDGSDAVIPSEAAHAFMLVFIAVCTVSSMSIVKLQKRPVLSDYTLQPVEAAESANLTLDPIATPTPQPTARNQFPLSALMQASPMSASTRTTTQRTADNRRASLATSLTSLMEDSDAGDETSEMDWTPTQNTHTAFAPRGVPSVVSDASSVPPTPSPMFAWDHGPTRRGGAAAALKPPPVQTTPARALAGARHPWRAEENPPLPQESPAEMRLGPPRLALRAQETGLESMFNSVFSISDEPAEMLRRGDGDADDFAGDSAVELGSSGRGAVRWVGAGTWTLAVAAVFGMAVAWFMTGRRLVGFEEALERLLGKDGT